MARAGVAPRAGRGDRSQFDHTSVVFWDQQYTGTDVDAPYDWLLDWAVLRPALTATLPSPRSRGGSGGPSVAVLELGCGNSTLGHDLHELGYGPVVCVDFSDVVIEQMQHRYAHVPASSLDCTPATGC